MKQLLQEVRYNPLLWLLALFPVVFAAEKLWHESHTLLFVLSVLAIVPLATLLSHATESVAAKTGDAVGGLLNATLGNLTKLIIALAALRAGEYMLVKASIAGAIVTNTLFMLGASFLLGGLKHHVQEYNRVSARMQAGLLFLATIALLIPSAVSQADSATLAAFTRKLSLGLAVLLIMACGLGMLFSLKTHRELFANAESGEAGEAGEAPWPLGVALGTLAGVTVLVALVSEVFVESVQEAAEAFGMTPAFVGCIVVALVGGAAEMASAFSGARKNRLDLSVGIALGSASQIPRSRCGWLLMISLLCCACCAAGQDTATNAPTSKFRSAEDGWLDISGFIDADYGFLPVVLPISEPAVGYGAAVGPAFIRKAPGTSRPNVTVVGGLATENGSWGAFAGDSRYWLDGRLQTLVGAVYASVNLDFYGIGRNDALSAQPLSYNLEPKGAMAQAKYRIGESPFWAGLAYGFVSTEVTFDAPPGTPNLPDLSGISKVGGVNPSFSFDTRDNIFTPTRGTYLEAGVGISSQALGGDSEFQRLQILAMQYVPLHPRLSLGLRGQVAAAFGDTPFYLEPFIWMRGVPAMRYQGDSLAQIEAELRWQFWKRFSLVGFAGGGAVWTKFEDFEGTQTAVAGGVGFRYEMARKHGIHMGLDVAFGPDDPTIYITIGSAWLRP